jgi:hypothetical protein
MPPRRYACHVIFSVFFTFLCVVATNLVIDPQGVFGTGIFGASPNLNFRYASLENYRKASDRHDSLLFGSSRARAFSTAELSSRMQGGDFASFWFPDGMVVDFLPFLEYVLNEKTAQGKHPKAVFLLLDMDGLGRRLEATHQAIQMMMPPGMPGQSTVEFWWKNLSAVVFRSWINTVKAYLRHDPGSGTRASAADTTFPSLYEEAMRRDGFEPAKVELMAESAPPAGPADAPAADNVDPRTGDQLERVTMRADFPRHIQAFERIVSLCRDNDIELVIATSPLSVEEAAEYNWADMAKAIDIVSRIAPIWDFSDTGHFLDHPELWDDPSHFKPVVADMMLRRIFGESVPEEWKSFGRHIGQAPAS